MDDKSNSKNSSEHTNILDLHECIFREIFDNVDHHELYFTVRSVCRVLKSYVESYIELKMFHGVITNFNTTITLWLPPQI